MLTESWRGDSGDWGLWSSYERKGELGGQCQRFVCVNPDAYWLDERDARYYCAACAESFNAAALRSGEVPTCVRL